MRFFSKLFIMYDGLLAFLVTVFAISLSGVLMPGPMTAAVVERGVRSRFAGLYISMGHGIVEAPLIILLALGASSLLKSPQVRAAIGIAGGLYLLYAAWGLLFGRVEAQATATHSAGSSVISGMALSLLNPYFLFWWATVGMGLLAGALKFGAIGVGLFIVAHLACDVLWCALLGMLSNAGLSATSGRAYRVVRLMCGVAMVYFGGLFIYGAFKA